MNKIRPAILLATIVLSAFVAYGLFSLPSPKPADYDGFSSARVVEDLKVKSQEPHSIIHPENRAKVRDYFVERLRGLGAEPVLYHYENCTGHNYNFDATNIYAEFPPLKAVEDTTYIMFVAHYDSRYPQPVLDKTVESFGAADDGYGVATSLECLTQALKVRENWNQGVKILFTDAEEVGMVGMKQAYEHNKELFENVGLMINIESRGTYGPALLFETSPNNSKVVDFYKEFSKYHYTYSLTTVVYTFLPNFTDFTIVRDEIPGVNFSTVADINHYHTDLDNIDNISEETIQHYGEQILPMALEYLTNEKYADKDYFKAEDDCIFCTIPLLGMFKFTKVQFIVLNVIVFLLFLLSFMFEALRGRLDIVKALKRSLYVLLAALGALAIGELVAYACAAIVGTQFKLFGVIRAIAFDNTAMVVLMVVMVAAALLVYLKLRSDAVKKTAGSMRANAGANAAEKCATNMLYGTLALLAVLTMVMTFTLAESFMFLIPLGAAVLAMILWRTTGLKLFIPLAIAFILLHAFSFYYALAMALSIGAIGAVMFLAFFDVMVLIPLSDLYLIHFAKKK
jgi:hypothetical protein